MSNLVGKQKCCRACVGKMSPHSSSQKHCSATAGGPAPVHSPGDTPREPPVPSPPGLGATTDAATLPRLPCCQAGNRSETLAQAGRHWVCPRAPEGSPHRELACEPSAAQLQLRSARHLFPKLLRTFDHVHTFLEKPHMTHTRASIIMYVISCTI